MIEKQEGNINGIIYDYTVYNDSKLHYYLSVNELLYVIEKIIETNETTKYIYIMPFYVNEKLQKQIEFEEMLFYLECDSNVTEEKKRLYILQQIDFSKGEDNINYYFKGEEIIDNIKKLNHLCDHKEISNFQNILKDYIEYLIEYLIPKITKIVLEEFNLNIEDILNGYICFEIFSD